MLYAVKNDDAFLKFSEDNLPSYTYDINQATVDTMVNLIRHIFMWGKKFEKLYGNNAVTIITKPHYFVEAKPSNNYTAGSIL